MTAIIHYYNIILILRVTIVGTVYIAIVGAGMSVTRNCGGT